MQHTKLSPTAARRPRLSSVLLKISVKNCCTGDFWILGRVFCPGETSATFTLQYSPMPPFLAGVPVLNSQVVHPQKLVVTGTQLLVDFQLRPKKPEPFSTLSKTCWAKPSMPELTFSWTTKFCWIAGRSKFPNRRSFQTLLRIYFFLLWPTRMAHNLSLALHYVPSQLNAADPPSRVLSDLDCTLSADVWKLVDTTFGPHSIDLMALPSNVRYDRSGNPLRFFSPFPCVQSAGTNVFAQEIAPQENAYVFPPFVLIGPLFKFLESQSCTFTMIVPDICPRKYWWPLVYRRDSCAFKLSNKGERNILLFPAKSGPSPWTSRPLQWDLWAFRIQAAQV